MWPPMHQGIESVHQGVLRWFSDLASAENSVKKRTQFFPFIKRARVLVNSFSMSTKVLCLCWFVIANLVSLPFNSHTSESSKSNKTLYKKNFSFLNYESDAWRQIYAIKCFQLFVILTLELKVQLATHSKKLLRWENGCTSFSVFKMV